MMTESAPAKAIGSNHLTIDGVARWVQAQKLLFLHSWNPGGARDSYMFQDDIGPELQAKVVTHRGRSSLLTLNGSPISAPCREIKHHRPKSSLGCC